jgi:hypothetical protein
VFEFVVCQDFPTSALNSAARDVGHRAVSSTTSVNDWHIHARNASGCYFVIVSANVLQIPVDDNISRNGTEATSNGTPQR